MTHPLSCRQADDSLSETWPGFPESVTAARHWLRARLAGVDPRTVYVAEQVVCELVANAVRHTRSGLRDAEGRVGEFELAVKVLSSRVVVAVTDEGADTVPVARDLDPEEALVLESGRGLWMMSQLSMKWGHRPVAGGRITWATIAR